MQLANIVQGASNKLLSDLGIADVEVEILAAKRLAICNTCTLLSDDRNNCDKNKVTEKQIYGNRYELINGCGCRIELKARSNSKCPLDKWV